MKSLVSLLLLAVIQISAFGQKNIPNSGFENWETINTPVLDKWVFAGNVSSTSDAFSGSKAILLENKAASNTRGFIATGPFINDKLVGIPYDEQPLSARFRAKFDLALGDQAQAAVLFYYKGNLIGYQSMMIEGNSADTFQYFSLPITWVVSTSPDSVSIVLSSKDLQNNVFNGDGSIIFDDFHFATISTRNKEVPNGDFEDWTQKSKEHLTSWFTTDEYLLEIAGIEAPTPFVRQTTSSKSGSNALELVSQKLGNDLIAGMALTGSSFSNLEKPSFAVNDRWKYLEGYYKYTPVNGDTAFVGVMFFKRGIQIGGAQIQLSSSTSSYTYFAEEIGFFTNDIPDSAFVFVSTCNPDHPRGNGSKLVLDELQFSNQNAGIYSLDENKLSVYPNPFTNTIRFKGTDRMLGADFTVVDVNGHIVKEGTLVRNLSIDLSNNLPGVYIIHLTGKHVNTSKILIKE